MVDLIAATSSSSESSSTGAAAGSAAKLADDFDDFLTLLTTQLQHQDPMDPMDSNQFTQQLVSFSGVEQQIRTNKNLENLTSLISLSNIASAASYLGNEALIAGNKGDHDGASGIKWLYQSEDAAENITLEVKDTKGNLIYSEDGEKAAGQHTFNWTGVDAAGNPVPAGNYTLSISAEDASGGTITPVIAVQETIKAVDTGALEPVFTVGPNDVDQSKILQLIHKG